MLAIEADFSSELQHKWRLSNQVVCSESMHRVDAETDVWTQVRSFACAEDSRTKP